MKTLKPVGKHLPNPPETHKVEPENPWDKPNLEETVVSHKTHKITL